MTRKTLRSRYRALKETADKQELLGKVEECRTQLEDEFGAKLRQIEGELTDAQVMKQSGCTLVYAFIHEVYCLIGFKNERRNYYGIIVTRRSRQART